jgi:ZIP family zinc transporter
VPIWLSAGLWGLFGASSLLLGALVAFLLKLPRSITAGIMSFGCGVLISAVAYDLLEADTKRAASGRSWEARL